MGSCGERVSVRRPRWSAGWLLALMAAVLAFAGEPLRKTFDLAAGPAEQGLRAFAEQAGVELVFTVEHVQGVKTRAVKGRYTLREALDRMLVGSPLAVAQDAPTGAFLVTRRPPSALAPNAPRASPPSPPRMAAPVPAREGDAVVLNPFLVQTDRDRGYAAAATLAGTRLHTPLRDLGASVSVYTKNFISDLGAADHRDVLIYATGMEAGGPGGNFSNGANDINDPVVVGDGARVSPQTQWRTRGLAAPNATRGFFVNDIAGDAYNTESITVSRGPNAVLFGVGSPAGVVDTALLRPGLTAHANRAEFRVGDNDSVRQVLDLNRVLIPGRLAFRLAALRDDERFDQRPAYEEKRRIFGTAAFEPFRTMAWRASFEAGTTRANRPFQVLPFDSISPQWKAAGRPTWDWRFYDDPARNPDAASVQANEAFNASPVRWVIGQAQIFGGIVAPFSSVGAATPDQGFRSTTGMGNAAHAVRIGLLEPRVNLDQAFDGIAFYETFNVGEIPAGYYADNRRPAGIKFQGFTSLDAFDFQRNQIDETGRQGDSFHTFTGSFEQRAWQDRLGLELAGYSQRYDNRNRNSFFGTQGNANHVRIDPNVFLPDGRPNPNLGRPYAVMSQQQYRSSFTRRDTLRATGFLRYDFNDRSPALGRWLGRHTLTGLGERARIDTLNYYTTLRTTGAAAETIGANPLNFNRLPNLLVYLGDSVLGGAPLRLNAIRTPAIRPGLSVPTGFFSAPVGTPATVQADYLVAPTVLKEIFTGGSVQRELIESRAAVWQGHWFADQLVTTVGWRRDEDFLQRQTLSYDAARPDETQRGFAEYRLPARPPPSAAREITSYSAVLRWPPRLARPFPGVETSVFFNTSENFTPLGPRVNFFNERLAAPLGRTREFGANLGLFADRLNLRYTRFTTSVRGATYVVPFNYQNAIVQMTGFWHTERNTNPGIDRTADIEAIFAALPANFRDVHQFAYSGTVEERNLGRTVLGLNDVADTTDYVARGHELELVFNPTPRLRLLANAASQNTVQQNIAPFTRALLARMRPVWDALAGVPRTGYPPGWVPGTPLPANIETVGQYVESTVYVPYAIMAASEGSSAAEQRHWRVNAVAHYTFAKAGPLRGWSAGGGVRWQSRVGIGYPASYRADGSAFIDIAHPHYGPPEINVDLFAGYTRKLWRDRLEWSVQLNLRNVVGDEGLIPVTAQPDGTTASARLPPERRWYLTNTFSF